MGDRLHHHRKLTAVQSTCCPPSNGIAYNIMVSRLLLPGGSFDIFLNQFGPVDIIEMLYTHVHYWRRAKYFWAKSGG